MRVFGSHREPKLTCKFHVLGKRGRPLSPAAQALSDLLFAYVAQNSWST